MPDNFSSVRRKLAQARRHADLLDAAIAAFGATNPYEIETVGDPVHGRGSWRIKGTPKQLPEEIPLIAGDAAHTARSAFDHFAVAVVASPDKATAFPVWRAPRVPNVYEWRALVKDKLKGADRRLIQAVEDLEGFRTGKGEWLWCLDELDRIDKHIDLIEVVGANTGVGIDFAAQMRQAFPDYPAEIPDMPVVLRPEWTPAEAGEDLVIIQDPKGLGVEPVFHFTAAIRSPDLLRGIPVVDALRRLTDQAEDLLLNQLAPLA